MDSLESSAPPSGRSADARKLRRAYKACISCRKRKARCDLGGRDGPPCTKCRREQRECVFTRERSWTAKDVRPSRSDVPGPPLESTPPASSLGGASQSLNQSTEAPSSAAHVSTSSSLVRSVVTTVVSNGTDALDLLFEAGSHNPRPRSNAHSPLTNQSPHLHVAGRPATSTSFDAVAMWEGSKFVKMVWLSAPELVLYIDFFVEHMLPLSPMLALHRDDYENNHRLISKEPLLCVTILMIASRYCPLPGQGSVSKGYFIHDRMSVSCQQLISRLMFGQERGPIRRARSLGSIEALLLLTEWHQRSLHFPPVVDGWESDAILIEDNDSLHDGPASSWIQEIMEPSRRSDRMSWMLIGAAMSLGYEINVFTDDNASHVSHQPDAHVRKRRVRTCLQLFANQIASRFGCSSLPPHMGRPLKASVDSNVTATQDSWEGVLPSWMELTRLLKSITEMIFPSKTYTQQLLRDGRHVLLLEHFEPLLSQWEAKYMTDPDCGIRKRQILIEYKYVRIYCNSIGMQAVCERAFADQMNETPAQEAMTSALALEDPETKPVRDVVTDSCALLETAAEVAARGVLRLFPVRIFARITAASIFLLKALGIGVRNRQLRYALELLDKTVDTLRSAAADDMHLAGRYAELLEMHVSQLRQNFSLHLRQARPERQRLAPDPPKARLQNISSRSNNSPAQTQLGEDRPYFSHELDSLFDGFSTEDMLSLPFDPLMAPLFPVGEGVNTGDAVMNSQGAGFDLFWNLTTPE